MTIPCSAQQKRAAIKAAPDTPSCVIETNRSLVLVVGERLESCPAPSAAGFIAGSRVGRMCRMARAAGVPFIAMLCGVDVLGLLEELGCWSVEDPFCGSAPRRSSGAEVSAPGVLPVVPMLGVAGCSLFWPDAPVVGTAGCPAGPGSWCQARNPAAGAAYLSPAKWVFASGPLEMRPYCP